MKNNRRLYPITLMARVLNVARSGYYAWYSRKPSDRQFRDRGLRVLIRDAHTLSRQTYGSIRIQRELAAHGQYAGRDHITRLRKEMGLRCIQIKKFKATTNSKNGLPISPNRVDQKFAITTPGMIWGTDITYIATDEGWLYLAGVKDFGSREILGYSMDSLMTTELVREALANAIRLRKPRTVAVYTTLIFNETCG
ncbi:MAG: IS3 family transposase [Rectinemataceae bacterium]|nr:IS3 family transposase [Rectinemataceae bacterium]